MNTILIIDLYGIIFRSYYGIREISHNQLNINAVYGTIKMLLQIFEDVQHDSVLIAMDGGGKTHRHDLFKQYKANRSSCPEDLKHQFQIIEEFIEAMQIPQLKLQGFEADDIIASCTHFAKNHSKIVIATSDKDLMQLVNDNILLYSPYDKNFINEDSVIKTFNVPPSKIADFLALVGDASDNIPGVQGIGPKSAAELLSEYESVNDIYSNIKNIKTTLATKLNSSKDLALLSLELAKLRSYDKILQIINNADVCKFNYDISYKTFTGICAKYNMQSIIKMIHKRIDNNLLTNSNQDHQRCLF